MKATGVIRRIDDLGRIVVPKEIRNRLSIKEDDPVEIYVEGDKIILKRYEDVCFFCGSYSELKEFKGKKICVRCIAEIK